MISHNYFRLLAACLVVGMLTFFASCNPDDEVTDIPSGSGNLATLNTLIPSNITSASAVSGGNITNDGGSAITQRGVVWSTIPSPTMANNSTSDGSGAGSFTSNLTGLTPNTTYYVYAYAVNSAGTAYGDLVFFTPTQSAGTIVSNPGEGVTFNGHQYPSIVLGNGQEWMAENLSTASYSNGDPIPNVTDGYEWTNLNIGAWAYYNNDSLFDNPYGKLYNWYAAIDSRNVCPSGWHVPTNSDWSDFINYLDPLADGGDNGNNPNIAGGKMKSVGTQYWQTPNQDATNEVGFFGLPGGLIISGQPFSSFASLGRWGSWWSSSSSSSTGAWTRNLYYGDGIVGYSSYNKKAGHSIRCLRD
jgi:uncharacterized protein (TIGR02145 family)